jgi:Skp family chaperone for outer membrane proteins
VNIRNQDTLTKLIDMIPDLVDKFTQAKDEDIIADEEAVDIAFPKKDDEGA